MSHKSLDIDALVEELKPELLPDVVVDISNLIGYKATIKLVQAVGGLDFAVPMGDKRCPARTLLTNAVGKHATDILINCYGGERVYIPRCHAAFNQLRYSEFRRDVAKMVAGGAYQKTAIHHYAPLYGFTERWAYTVLAEETRSDAQMRLFD
ncbi:Mor transcription activator family protein [Psychrobacter sp. T6-1]|uniref:Mor transcription activator family protein n=1 Tax=Psychrobacter sp. T6-1 TaxID=3457447 RepID=UPI003FD4E8F2